MTKQVFIDKKTETHDPSKMIVDEMREAFRSGPVVGKGIAAGPFEMETVIDFTGLRGSGSNIYYSLIFQLPKWTYHIKKVDEFMEVTPTWAEYYNLTIAQKQKLEASIKTGLTSAAQAVSDFELLKHDLRRYREILDYFIKSHKHKDEHVLRSLFVDRVDAHTGEGYSMITMTKRWPTIITDFIRMKSEWNNRDTVRKELDLSDAEATVLMTKNQLYNEWKELFLPTVKERVARLEVMVESRKQSIDEYRKWLKPYVARYKMIREKSEVKPAEDVSNAFMTPGFGQSQASTGVRIWFWKHYRPPEKGKPESIPEKGKGKNKFVIDPYDSVVKEWQKKIEKRYNVKFTEKDVYKIMDEALEAPPGINPMMYKDVIYYVFFDAKITLSMIRTPPPEGFETDNLMFLPLKAYVLSQNVLLLHILEVKAREMAFENEVNRLIGTKEAETEAFERIEKEFLPEEKKGPTRFRKGFTTASEKLRPPAESIFYKFVKRGPYEPVFRERVSKMYARGIGGSYGKVLGLIMQKMQVE